MRPLRVDAEADARDARGAGALRRGRIVGTALRGAGVDVRGARAATRAAVCTSRRRACRRRRRASAPARRRGRRAGRRSRPACGSIGIGGGSDRPACAAVGVGGLRQHLRLVLGRLDRIQRRQRRPAAARRAPAPAWRTPAPPPAARAGRRRRAGRPGGGRCGAATGRSSCEILQVRPTGRAADGAFVSMKRRRRPKRGERQEKTFPWISRVPRRAARLKRLDPPQSMRARRVFHTFANSLEALDNG